MVDLNFSAECEALAHGDAKPVNFMGAVVKPLVASVSS